MQPLAYLHLQLRLEGKEIVSGLFLREVEAVPGEEMPWMLMAQLANGSLVAYYDEGLARNLQEELIASFVDIEFPNIDPLREVLKNWKLPFDVGYYKTYIFPSIPVTDEDVLCLSRHDKKVKEFGFDGFAEQVYAVERDDKIVSACVSARENGTCGEAWVYTSPEYRQQGFAQRAVSAWARSLIRVGKVPFYSHKIENTASANLAGRLKLKPVFEEIAISRA
ncbi:MAG TPA: GNAT family N-acetyltransferase [Anaerolineales bacterium]|nr:GNAT family N-acetyltransferase [Anaerolineales bacterium]